MSQQVNIDLGLPKFLITSLYVMMPNGNLVGLQPKIEDKQLTIHGLAFGPVTLDGTEIWAVRQLLNTMFG